MSKMLVKLVVLPFVAPFVLGGCDVAGDDVDALPTDACVADDGGSCTAGEGGTGGAGGSGGGGGGTGGAANADVPLIDVIWDGPGAGMPNDDDSVTVAIDDGADAVHTYRFGLSETGSANGWYGEDCLPGEVNGKDVCHEVGEEGIVVQSTSRLAEVDSTHTLLFKASHDAGDLTYVVIQVDTNKCWTFGNDPSYYVDSVLHCETYTTP